MDLVELDFSLQLLGVMTSTTLTSIQRRPAGTSVCGAGSYNISYLQLQRRSSCSVPLQPHSLIINTSAQCKHFFRFIIIFIMFPLRMTQLHCDNPLCMRRDKLFSSQRGFEAHLRSNSSCRDYFFSKTPPGMTGPMQENREGIRRRVEYAGAPPNPHQAPAL